MGVGVRGHLSDFSRRPRFGSVPRPWVVGATATLVMLAGAGVSITGVRASARAAIGNEVRSNLARLASAAATQVDARAHARLVDAEQHGGEEYERAVEPLRRMLAGTVGVRFVYTLRPADGRMLFVLDATPIGDADGDGVEDHSFLMDEYEDPDPAAWASFEAGGAVTTDEPYADQWGTFLSGYAPVRAADGTIEAIVGVDITAENYERRLAAVDKAAAAAGGPALVMALLVGVGAGVAATAARRAAGAVEAERAKADAERARAEAAAARAEAANTSKTRFLANMSHELRTPMTAILGCAELTTDESLPAEERAEWARTIQRNGQHLLTLINDVLDLSKIDAGRFTIHPEPADPREVLDGVVDLMRVRAESKGLSLSVVGPASLPARVTVDAVRVRQVLLNLVGNAVKFTDEGGIELSVEVVRGERPVLRVGVHDTGMGMRPEQIERLFRPFSQVDESASRRFGGTGLGLTISRQLAQLMGGTVEVRSTHGVGSTFTFTAECGPIVERSERPGEEPSVSAPAASVQPEGLRGVRILVAEDGVDNQRLIRFFLEKAGAGVEIVENGLELVTEAMASRTGGRPYDLIVTDWQMPVLGGDGAVRELRGRGWTGPIAALTAHAMAEDREACLAAGCDEVMTKPIDRALLLHTCARLATAAGPGRRAA